jgi:hypothetical protein
LTEEAEAKRLANELARRLKKRSLRKQKLSLQKLRNGKAKKARRSQEMG